MTTQPDGPCDTRMMGIVHSALRRDLVRVRMVLADPTLLTAQRRVGIADHVGWLLHTLHLHHHGEDVGLYPMVLRNDPTTRELVDAMDGDHQRIDVTMCVTQREWDEWNDQVNVRSKPFLYLAEEGHWVLDNLGADDRRHTLELLPPVPRFVLLRILGGRYRRRRALLWDGTPAEHVPSMSLQLARTWAS